MARRVFFSFHYDDVVSFRANVVRQHGATKDSGTAGFFDASIWEDARTKGDAGLKRLIQGGLDNTSVTCVLIGSQTFARRWVRYEIVKSYDRENALFGVHINSVRDKSGKTFLKGPDPFACLGLFVGDDGSVTYHERENVTASWKVFADFPTGERTFDRKSWGRGYTLSSWVRSYDWTSDKGFENFASWVAAAQ